MDFIFLKTFKDFKDPWGPCYSLGNEILQEVSDAKYLGIQIDNKLDWNKHFSTVAARGQSKLAFLNWLNRNLKGCPKKLRDTAYISLIRPALEYSCSVWHPHKKSSFRSEHFQIVFLSLFFIFPVMQ